MRYFLDTETNVVASLDDGEPASALPKDRPWTPVHLHRGAGPMHREPSRFAKIFVSTVSTLFVAAVIAAITGLAVWAWTAAF